MKNMKKSAEELKQLSIEILEKAGAPKHVASRVTEHLIGNNLVGTDSHGVIRIPNYVDFIINGVVNVSAEPKVVKETSSIAVLDGCGAFGQVAAAKAAEMAIKKAKETGISLVALRNTSHIGRLGEYVEMIAKENLIGFVAVNYGGGGICAAPAGGRERRLNTNPMAWGIPTGCDDQPLIIDMATSAVSEGKVRVKRNQGEKIPEGWVIDSEGKPTTDPNDFYGPPEGALLPMGGYKGYGLALVVDILAGGLSSGGCGRHGVKEFAQCTTVIAIDPSVTRPLDEFVGAVDGLIDYVKSATPIKEGVPVMVPNEPECLMRQRRRKEGIELDAATWKSIVETAKKVGLDIE